MVIWSDSRMDYHREEAPHFISSLTNKRNDVQVKAHDVPRIFTLKTQEFCLKFLRKGMETPQESLLVFFREKQSII